MVLPTIEVPARLAGAFVSDAMAAVDVQTLGATMSGAALVENGARFSQMAQIRLWETLPQIVPVQAQGLLDIAWTTQDAIATFQNGELGDKLAAISEGGLAVLDTMFEAMSIVESVPLIGIIAKIGTTVQRIFWNQWIAAHRTPPADVGFGYDRLSDELWVRDVLQHIETGDLTNIFAPFIARPQGWDVREVQDLLKHGDNRWTFVAPQGTETGVGNVPGTTSMSQGYQSMYGWEGYRPSTVNACAAAWQMAMAHGRTRYLVDVVQLREQWAAYWLAVAMGSINVESRKDGSTAVLARAQSPMTKMPEGLYGSDATQWFAKMEAAGHRRWGSAVDMYPFKLIASRGYPANMAGLTEHNLERQLRGRQLQGLKTLLVAYVSRDDPAFRSDTELQTTLEENRERLLRHKARWDVDLERVPDADYRAALVKATPGTKPVGGLVFGDGGTKPIGGLSSGREAVGLMPTPALGFKLPSALPMIGGASPMRSSGSGVGGLLALAVLGFLASR